MIVQAEGVLQNGIAHERAGHGFCHNKSFVVDPDCVHRLRQLVEKHDLDIVLACRWKNSPGMLESTFEWCGWDTAPKVRHTENVVLGNYWDDIALHMKYNGEDRRYVILTSSRKVPSELQGLTVLCDPAQGFDSNALLQAEQVLQ